jgi:hypothetical protein
MMELETIVAISLSVERYNQLIGLVGLETLLVAHAYELPTMQCRCRITLPHGSKIWGVTQWSEHVASLIRAMQEPVKSEKDG